MPLWTTGGAGRRCGWAAHPHPHPRGGKPFPSVFRCARKLNAIYLAAPEVTPDAAAPTLQRDNAMVQLSLRAWTIGVVCVVPCSSLSLAAATASRRACRHRAALMMAAEVEVDLDARYATISAAQPVQQEVYTQWLGSSVDVKALTAKAATLGSISTRPTARSAMPPDFESKKVPLCFDFVYCRHGKTTGNTEPRVYQGYVDEPENALNEIGLRQAEEAADKLDALNLDPDLVVLSPLSRAAETGLAYTKRHPELEERTEYWEDAAEMRFGAWDNVMVKDLPDENICHLFYLAQNAVVKPSEPYVRPSTALSLRRRISSRWPNG